MRHAQTTNMEPVPAEYEDLVRLHPLRPVDDDVTLENATEIVGRLAVLDERTRDQEDYLSVLTTLIERYEAEHYAKEFDGVAALDALKFLLEEHGMNGSDLGRLLGCRTLGAAILRGDRGLSRKHILALARHFRVDPGVFLD